MAAVNHPTAPGARLVALPLESFPGYYVLGPFIVRRCGELLEIHERDPRALLGRLLRAVRCAASGAP